MIVCAGEIESFEFAKPIGIGLVDPAINLTSMLLNSDILPKKIIFIGTAGLYRDGQILEIYESSQASNIEISKILDLSYTPLDLSSSNNVSRETYRVNSSNYITKNSKIAEKFADLGFFIENMEFYTVLKVAKKFNISAYGIFCATNFCDENAHLDFLKNHIFAKKKLINYLKDNKII
ncbi:MAG: purine-nucleoside phosphorylase [Campylobacter sp.]|nr:purine-nucleoside phosphorylase [Campylobacter sp.]